MNDSNVSFTGSIPENYDKYLGPMLLHAFADDLASRVPAAPGVRVLEIACGTGIVTERLLRRLAGRGTVVATDLSEAMFASAAQRIRDPNVTWRQADGTKLPFPEGAFDAVVCQFGLMFFPDKVAGVREAYRVLAPGGRYCFNVWDAIERNPVQRIAHETLGGFFPTNPPQFYNIPFSLRDTGQIRDWLERAGFTDIDIETVAKVGSGPSARNAAIGLIEGNPVYTDIMKRRPDALREIETAVANKIAAELGDPVRAPLRAHVFCAHKR